MRDHTPIKIIILLICTILSLTLFSSCWESIYDNKGYPKRVNFTAEGGTQVFSGKSFFRSFKIEDANERYILSSLPTNDTIIASYQWLTIKTKDHSNEIEISAEKNETGEKRWLNIEGCFGREYADIKVVQDGRK